MQDRRMLRRQLTLVLHAEDLLRASLDTSAAPSPPDASAVLGDLVRRLAPLVAAMPVASRQAQPDELADTVSGQIR